MTTTYEAHSGQDYTVVMKDGETTEDASIRVFGPGREALGIRVAALLSAAERLRDVVDAFRLPGEPMSRAPAAFHEGLRQRAEEIWRAMERTPDVVRGSDLEHLFTLAAQHFAEIYKCSSGHAIKPEYIAALPYDFLQALMAVVIAQAEGAALARRRGD